VSYRRKRGFVSLLSAHLARGATTTLLIAATTTLAAQGPDYRDPRIPRSKDGKPNLTAPAPRRDGKPDLSGLWQAERTPLSEYAAVLGPGFSALQIDTHDITKHVVNVFWDLKPAEAPLTAEGTAAYQRRRENLTQWPHTHCLPAGVPADMFVMTFKMIQAPQEIVMLTEIGSPARQITPMAAACPRILTPPLWATL
jgi:hypothetical protein